MNRRQFVGTTALAALALSANAADDTREIARDAFIWGYPIVDNYRVMYSYFADITGPEYKGAWNEVHSVARVFTPADTAIQTPNSDTPYSNLGADLRAEPLVFTVPKIEGNRYYSIQFVDLYTFNFAYVGSRATGNGAGNYLLAGPNWKGDMPAGIEKVIRCETELAMVLYRTQLFGPDDIDAVKAVQAGYRVQPLSAFLGRKPPPPAPVIDFPKPLSLSEERTSAEFFNELNFILQFCPVVPAEKALRQKFASIGIRAGNHIAASESLRQGMADGWAAYEVEEKKMATGAVTSGDLFGTREYLNGNYLHRMVGAIDGIYGNSRDEAVYPAYIVDADAKPLNGLQHYELRFAPRQLPPAKAFWSLTMYAFPSRLLVANALNRYLINSTMLASMKKEADGGITLYIQQASPGKDREPNWLPAPDGPFVMALRIYWPEKSALDGSWKKPALRKVA